MRFKKVLFITNLPVPYRIDFYNELGVFCDLTVIFEAEYSRTQNFNWKKNEIRNFKPIFLGQKFYERKLNLRLFKYLRKLENDVVFMTNYAYCTEMAALLYLKAKGIEYYYEIDGALIKKEESFLKKIFKSFMLKGAKGYFSPSKLSDEYITYYAKSDKIIRYPFTSLLRKDILQSPIENKEKKGLRDKLGIREEKVILAVGQFIHRKGFDILLKATQQLEKSIGIYFIGGEAPNEYVQLKNIYNLSHTHFLEFKKKEDLAEYFKAADLFVLPTREDIWGLVINEAMAYGLPVISTNKCVSALELVQDMECIIETENVEQLSFAIQRVICDDHLLSQLSHQNLKKIREYSIEKMVEAHLEIINKN